MIGKISDDAQNETLKADEVIHDIFKKRIYDVSVDELDNANLRSSRGNPPGKKDSIGDAILWECLLLNVPDNEDLHLVSDDNDFNSILNSDKIHPFLEKEWVDKKSSQLFFYRKLSTFFRSHFPFIILAHEIWSCPC